jgi:hypothetical protein
MAILFFPLFVGASVSPKPFRLSGHAQEFVSQHFFSSSSSVAPVLVGK